MLFVHTNIKHIKSGHLFSTLIVANGSYLYVNNYLMSKMRRTSVLYDREIGIFTSPIFKDDLLIESIFLLFTA